MPDTPPFRKPDRYKASSYRTYNFKAPASYDSWLALRLCQVPLWDRIVIAELGHDIPSLRILDVGCATGRLLCALADAGATQLAGVDLAPRILDVARPKLTARGLEPDLRPADAEDNLPWPSESFDVLTLTGVLHHLYRPRDALHEFNRLLRPGGRLIIIDPCFFPPVRQIFNLYLRLAPHAGDFHFYSRSRALQLFDNQTWTTPSSKPVGLFSYLITTSKLPPTAPANKLPTRPTFSRDP